MTEEKQLIAQQESLWKLQDRLAELEESINCDETELELLVGDICSKVDGIKYVIDVFHAEAERFKQYKDQMAARQKSLLKAAERLEAYSVKCLEGHGTTFELGSMWTMKLRENKRVEVFQDQPTDVSLIMLGIKNDAIRNKYEWDKMQLKKILSSDHDPLFDDIAKIVTSKSIQFTTINAAAKKGKNNE